MRWSVIVFAVAAVACGAAHVAILASVLRRRSAVVDANVPRPKRGVEILWAVVPALAVAALLAATWPRVAANGAADSSRVEKVAQ